VVVRTLLLEVRGYRLGVLVSIKLFNSFTLKKPEGFDSSGFFGGGELQ
jgi:hypothetical protein